jgi:hypothetical protein
MLYKSTLCQQLQSVRNWLVIWLLCKGTRHTHSALTAFDLTTTSISCHLQPAEAANPLLLLLLLLLVSMNPPQHLHQYLLQQQLPAMPA